jgi:hypothetical protein
MCHHRSYRDAIISEETRRQPAADRPLRQDLRAADTDRDRTATRLRSEAAAGRLTVDELSERLDAAFAARTLGELDALVADLPGDATVRRTSRRRLAPRPLVILAAVLVAIWALTGAGYFWPLWPLLGSLWWVAPWGCRRRWSRPRPL